MDYILYLLEQSNERGTPRNELEEIATRLATGARPRQIVETLVHNGWPREDANVVVAHVNSIFTGEMVRKARRRAFIGAVMVIASCSLAALTFVYGRAIGFYFVPGSAVFIGILILVRGLYDWARFARGGGRSPQSTAPVLF